MSFELASEVIRRYAGPGKLELIVLADMADASGCCHPSYALIAARTGKSARQALRTINEIIEDGGGVLTRRRRPRQGIRGSRSNSYRIDADVIAAMPLLELEQTDTHDGLMGEQTDIRGQNRPTPMSPEAIREAISNALGAEVDERTLMSLTRCVGTLMADRDHRDITRYDVLGRVNALIAHHGADRALEIIEEAVYRTPRTRGKNADYVLKVCEDARAGRDPFYRDDYSVPARRYEL